MFCYKCKKTINVWEDYEFFFDADIGRYILLCYDCLRRNI